MVINGCQCDFKNMIDDCDDDAKLNNNIYANCGEFIPSI